MADIFARAGQQFNGAFAADAAKIVFAGQASSGLDAGVGLLTQSVNVSYNQQISRLYEIGTNFTYLVAGRTQGQVATQRVLGPRPVITSFYTKYGNVCNAATNNLNFETETGCPQGDNPSVNLGAQGGLAKLAFKVKSAVITQLGISVNANDMIINESLQMMFVSLEF